MGKIYKYPPDNLYELEGLLAFGNVPEIIRAESLILYDTCSFRYHMNIDDPIPIFEYIKLKKSVVILTSTILMELASRTGNLGEKEKKYIEKMHDAGIRVYVVKEEDIYLLLCSVFYGIDRVNAIFSDVFRVVVDSSSSIRLWLEKSEKLLNQILVHGMESHQNIGSSFFSGARSHKTEKDNLGETLLAVCIGLMAYIPAKNQPIILFTDDKGAVRLIGKLYTRIIQKMDVDKKIAVRSTPALCWNIYKAGIGITSEEIASILRKANATGKMSISYSEEYTMGVISEELEVDEIAKRIIDSAYFTIYI